MSLDIIFAARLVILSWVSGIHFLIQYISGRVAPSCSSVVSFLSLLSLRHESPFEDMMPTDLLLCLRYFFDQRMNCNGLHWFSMHWCRLSIQEERLYRRSCVKFVESLKHIALAILTPLLPADCGTCPKVIPVFDSSCA
jgi:hypothetical protein